MRASLDADGLEGVKSILVLYLQDKSRQTTELPRPALHRDGGSEPSDEVTSTETACRLLTFITNDGLCLVGQLPLLLWHRFRIFRVVAMQIQWHLAVFRQLSVFNEVVAPLVFAPLVVLTALHAHPTRSGLRTGMLLGILRSQRVALIDKLAVVLRHALAHIESL